MPLRIRCFWEQPKKSSRGNIRKSQKLITRTNIIGTAETVETTHKSSGTLLDAGGAGSKKVVREYKVSPDMIKELPPLQAIIYDKQDVEHIKLLEVPFIDL